MSWKQNLCKLHNGVVKAAESRINTGGLPLAGGDDSRQAASAYEEATFAPRGRG